MIKRKIQKVKDSYLITVPAHICQVLGIRAGDMFSIELTGDKKITLAPVHDEA